MQENFELNVEYVGKDLDNNHLWMELAVPIMSNDKTIRNGTV